MNATAMTPKVTIVIPNWNTQNWLPGCLNGLRAQTYQNFQILLVDNGSTDTSIAFVGENYPEVEILAFNQNRGFASAVNAGIKQSHSEYVALLNADTVPQPTWLGDLVEILEKNPSDVGGVASKMLSLRDPRIIDDAGNTFSWYGSACKRGQHQSIEMYTQLEEIFSISGGASLYRRAFLEDVGYFDESFISYLEDVDLGLRGRLFGYRYLYAPTANVWHQWSGSRIPRPRYVYLCTRNRLALLLKNIPWWLLLKHSPTLLYGQLYFLLVYKKPFYSLAGMISFTIALPRLLRQRWVIQKRKTISNKVLEAMLSTELGEPALTEIIKAKLGRA
jgi:GT2 family glycosyltransferase